MARRPDDCDDATLRVLIAPGIGPATIRRLREALGSDRAIVQASAGELSEAAKARGPAASAIRRALDEADPAAERDAMRAAGASLVLHADPDYPALLRMTPEPPEALWVRGDLAASRRPGVAIVGARRCTSYGREQAGRFAALLAQSGLTIVSGGARGIDAAAHRGALSVRGGTIAVLGNGLADPYPPGNERLFDEIVAADGAVVTEFRPTAPPRAGNFPRRNRVIAGLSLGVLVIEAGRRSGALITARIAAEDHGREVMVLPGRVDSVSSEGCLRLIQEGAALVTGPDDVLRELDGAALRFPEAFGPAEPTAGEPGPRSKPEPAAGPTPLGEAGLTPDQRGLLEMLASARSSLSLNQLAARTGRTMSAVMADMTILEIHGRIDRDRRGVRLRA